MLTSVLFSRIRLLIAGSALLAAALVAACSTHGVAPAGAPATAVGYGLTRTPSSSPQYYVRTDQNGNKIVWKLVARQRSSTPAPALAGLAAAPQTPATPTPGPTLGSDFVWIRNLPYYDEMVAMQPNDPHCGNVHWKFTTTIPNVSPTIAPNPTKVDQFTDITLTQTGVVPTGVGNQTITSTCDDGTKAVTPATLGLVDIEWVDGATHKVIPPTAQPALVGTQTILVIQTTPQTELLPIPNEAPYNIWEASNTPTLVSSYQQDTSGGIPTYLFAGPGNIFIQRNFSFNWAETAAQSAPLGVTQPTVFELMAQVPAIFQGDEVIQTINAAFNSAGPTSTSATTNTGNVLLYPDQNDASPQPLQLSLGVPPLKPCVARTPLYGMEFNFQATTPTNAGGDYGVIQLIDLSQVRTAEKGATPSPLPTTNGFELDNSLLYSNIDLAGTSGKATKYCSTDSPGTDTNPQYANLSRNDSFQTYFVYKPSGANSVWVPLGLLTWRWAGTATQNNGTWTGPTSVTLPAPAFETGVPYNLMALPAWKKTFVNQ